MKLSGKRQNFLLTPTNEEVLLELTTKRLQSYRQLPIRYFQIADKFRDILKPKGLMRSSQFLMADMCSVDADEDSLKESALLFESMAKEIFKRLNIKTFRLEKEHGKYVDYVIPCADGETNIVISSDREHARYTTGKNNESKRASSVGMYFIFDRADKFSAVYIDKEGHQRPIRFGTYGLGLQRCFHAVVSQNRDNLGILFPEEVRPFDLSIIPINPKSSHQNDYSEEVYKAIMQAGNNPLLDDRLVLMKERARYADFIGVKYKVIIGDSEVKNHDLTVKLRGKRDGERISLENLLSLI
jgi:prolyl-tRNA synthetase